ncbi:MAG: sigma-70 family RNA polymerase sigma factor [Phycisphaerae bacterium]|nr:sigma-70 family RNA polymerase sigma factor [Phycisphaerae bacterium]
MDNHDAPGERLPPLRERQLIERAQRGCAESAHALVVAHQARLHAFVWRMVRNGHDAEEICQDTFLRAFQALDGFDFSYRFSTWLFTIGYRLCLNILRRRKRYVNDVDWNTVPGGRAGERTSAPGDDVANSDEARQLKEMIWESVDELTPNQRATVLLFYRESLSCQEIGEILAMPAATVKSHLHRARNGLRRMLGPRLVNDWPEVRFSETGSVA